jgi:hypothetical protein
MDRKYLLFKMIIQIAIVVFFGLVGGVLGLAIFLLPLKSPLNFWFGAVSGIFAGYFFYVRPCFNASLNRHAMILLAVLLKEDAFMSTIWCKVCKS